MRMNVTTIINIKTDARRRTILSAYSKLKNKKISYTHAYSS